MSASANFRDPEFEPNGGPMSPLGELLFHMLAPSREEFSLALKHRDPSSGPVYHEALVQAVAEGIDSTPVPEGAHPEDRMEYRREQAYRALEARDEWLAER